MSETVVSANPFEPPVQTENPVPEQAQNQPPRTNPFAPHIQQNEMTGAANEPVTPVTPVTTPAQPAGPPPNPFGSQVPVSNATQSEQTPDPGQANNNQPEINYNGGVTMQTQGFPAPSVNQPQAAPSPFGGQQAPAPGGFQPTPPPMPTGGNPFDAAGTQPGAAPGFPPQNSDYAAPGGFPPQAAPGFPPAQNGYTPPPAQGFPPAQGGFPPAAAPGGFPAPAQTGFASAAPGFPPAQGGYAAPSTPPAAPAQHGQRKYNMTDLYWLINHKIFTGEQFIQGETSFITLSFNANFNNLRFVLYNIDQNTIQAPAIILSNLPKVTTLNLHSEGAALLLANRKNNQTIRTQERMIQQANWTPNQSFWTWTEDRILLQTQDSTGTTHAFSFVGYQETILEGVLGYMVDGSSWNACLASGNSM